MASLSTFGRFNIASVSQDGTYHERAVRVLKSSVGGEDRVVGLNDRVSQSRSRVDAEFQLGFLSIIH
jgi:hypothetical protein